jgi:hypothetical protein
MVEKLFDTVRRLNPVIDLEQVEVFLKNHKPMKQDIDPGLTLGQMLHRLGISRFGKEISSTQKNSCTTSIFRNFDRFLSLQDLKYVFTQIEDGSERFSVGNYFTTTDLIKCLRKYEGQKKFILKIFREIQSENDQTEEDRRKKHEFTQECLRKYNAKERLTFYEKSTIGVHFLNDVDEGIVEMIRDFIPEKMAQLKKERQRKIDVNPCWPARVHVDDTGFSTLYADPEDEFEPAFITESLVFGNLLYDHITSHL